MSNDISGHLIFKPMDSKGTGYTFKMVCTGIRFEGEIFKQFYNGKLYGYEVKYRFDDNGKVYVMSQWDTIFRELHQKLIEQFKLQTAAKQDLMGFSWPRVR